MPILGICKWTLLVRHRDGGIYQWIEAFNRRGAWNRKGMRFGDVEGKRMTAEEKNWIDNASIYALLQKWRFSPIGSSYFQDKERSDYFQKVMSEKRSGDNDAWVRASKDLGWGH